MSGSKVYRLVGVAMLAAVGFVLMNFGIPLFFPFLKLDFSDLTVLLGGLIYGPVGGIAVAFVRSLLHWVFTGGGIVNLIGDAAAFIASVGFMVPVVLAIRNHTSVPRQLLGLGLGTLSLTAIMSVLNWLVLMPLYLWAWNFKLGMSTLRYVLVGVIPFNLIKGLVISIVFFAVAKALMPWLEKHGAVRPA